MVDIVVLGSLNMDLTIRVPRMPNPGETISGENLITSCGGKGANQAAAIAKLGSEVAMVGCVGQDAFGYQLKGALEEAGVNTDFTTSLPDVPTGNAVILVDQKGENCIVLSSGTNSQVKITETVRELIENSQILLLQLEIPLPIVIEAIKLAHQAGVTVILNPAPAASLPEEVYPMIDYLIPNETEAEQLSGIKIHDHKSAENAAKVLLYRGVKRVAITMGDKGAILVTEQGSDKLPAFKVKTVDTTGAGDAFIGGFTTALTEGMVLHQALRFAAGAGALAATRNGAQISLPTRKELEEFLSQHQ
jgi:ribokinase